MGMRLIFALSASAAALLAQSAGATNVADDQAPEAVAAAISRPEPAAAFQPLEQILAEFSRLRGVSFIFDSRIVRKKKIAPIAMNDFARDALERELRKADLDLHEVNGSTFAITSRRPTRLASLDLASIPGRAVAAAPLADMIIVTAASGSRLPALASNHLVEIDADALAYVDAVSPAEAVYELPQSVAAFTPNNTARFGALEGISLVDLRAFGPQRTAVLVDGRRRTPTPGGNGLITGVDLNGIGEPFLERIELMDRPSGARLGASAVAGAVNFALRSTVDGVETGARFGVSQQGDAEEYSAYLLAGDVNDTGDRRVAGGINITSVGGLFGDAREETANPYGFSINGLRTQSGDFLPGFGGSLQTPRGALVGAVLDDGSFAFAPRQSLTGDGGFEPYTGRLDQLYNWAGAQHLIIPVERALGYLRAEADVGRATVFFAGDLGAARSKVELAPAPGSLFQGASPVSGDAFIIDLDHPSTPAGVRDFYDAMFGGAAQSVVLEKRLVELGPRRQTVRRGYAEAVLGVRTQFSDGFDAELRYRFGRASVKTTERGRLDYSRFDAALDSAACAATPSCVAIDPFTDGGVSSAAAAFLTAEDSQRRLVIDEHELAARIGWAFPLAGGEDARLAAGADLRRAGFSDKGLAGYEAARSGGLVQNDSSGRLDTAEAFVTVDAPLLRGRAGVGAVDVGLAVRLSGASAHKAATNFETTLDWSPIDGVTLYTQQSFGRHPPNITELFNVGQTYQLFTADPCDPENGAREGVVDEKCSSDGPLGVPSGFRQTQPNAERTVYGNPDLDSERIRAGVYGVRIAPDRLAEWVPGRLSLSAAYIDYQIDDVVNGVDSLLDCYESKDVSSPSCGVNAFTGAPRIRRDPDSGRLIGVDVVAENRGRFEWRGVDIDMRYAYEPASLGPIDRMTFSGLHSILLESRLQQPGEAARDLLGLADTPRQRSLVSASMEAGPYGFAWFVHRRGAARSARELIDATYIPAVTTADMTVRYDISEAASVTIGAENIFDRAAPIIAYSESGNVFPQHYDLVGRRFSIAVRGRF